MTDLMGYPIVIRPLSQEDGGGFVALFPDLPGCASDGETPEESLRNAEGALAEWMDTARGRKDFVIPEPGARGRHMALEREAVKSAVVALAQKTDELDGELCDLRAKIEEIEEHLDHYAAWDRFEVVVGDAPVKVIAHRRAQA